MPYYVGLLPARKSVMTTPPPKPTTHRRFNFRGLITYLLTFSFFIMVISGLVSFVSPSGRIASQVDWSLLGLDRIAWQSLHLSFAAVFTVVGLLHLVFHWHGLLHYLQDRASHHLTLKWEAAIALVFTVGLISSAVLALPPASNLHNLTVQFRQTFWVDSRPETGSPSRRPVAEPKDAIPANGDPSLPRGHLPVPPEKPCSDCHRGQ
jgi:hypothetical protein